MNGFHDDYKTLVPKLLTETMLAVNSSFISHINLATGDVVPETKALAKGILDLLFGDMPKGIKMNSRHLDAMIELHNLTSTFARNIQHLFSESKMQVLLDTVKAVYSPFETFKQKYGQMERAILAANGACHPCTSLPVTASSVDQNQSQIYINDENADVNLAGKAALDLATVRLIDAPEKARKLFSLLEQSKDPRFHALPLTSQRVAAFTETVNELVYDVLISKVRQHLSDV